MSGNVFDSLRRLIEANGKHKHELSAQMDVVASALRERQEEIDRKKKSISEEIERGGKLTKHTISL
ncbi:hypothetical protein QZM92_26745 [Burkholderia multivorans]|uniref:hypothetical protein n=1 Tax=Burkholderia multivorans TaxID=87883 RepID=UPI001C9564DC|nr:hypothetical protein [Burkholderia multivorans]MBY4674313.1 hypothetical protein [Burkholderia multivorans]MDN7965583.1 hypothetical protein [Burkholderia multivorans]